MLVSQVANLANSVTQEILGGTGIINEDLSNVVDIGTSILNLGQNGVDNYCRSLVNQIGRMIFVDRPYSGGAPSVLMDGWQYGSILEKVRTVLPQAEENDTWQLQDGQSYDQDIFYQPDAAAKFFNKRVTFEIPRSFCYKQVEESFQNGQQLNAFFSMLYNAIDKSMTVKMDALIMRTINNMTAGTLVADPSLMLERQYGKTVNLLAAYRALNPSTTINVLNCLYDLDFLKFCAYTIKMYVSRLRKLSKLFNVSGTDKFTPTDYLHIVLLDIFSSAADVYLQSDTYHNEMTRLPKYETVPYWQGSGQNYLLTEAGNIDVSVINPVVASTTPLQVTLNPTTGENANKRRGAILGVMFDRDALGVTNLDRRVTTHWNAKGEFWNNFFKFDAGYFNDFDENFVVFYIYEEFEPTIITVPGADIPNTNVPNSDQSETETPKNTNDINSDQSEIVKKASKK